MKIKIMILSWLLHHANRKYKNPEFYKIKNRILKCYADPIGFDLQFIQGKKCYSCDGTGVYTYYGWDGKISGRDDCWHCLGGWFKPPTWVVLQKYQFGRYSFHQPIERVYFRKPDIKTDGQIEGYVEHRNSEHSDFAATILFLLYERGYLKRWYSTAGVGRYVRWWLPRNWLNNIVYHIKRRPKLRDINPCSFMACYQDDLPF